MLSQSNDSNGESPIKAGDSNESPGCSGKVAEVLPPSDTVQQGCFQSGWWLPGLVFLGLFLTIVFFMLPRPGSREGGRQATCTNNLKNVALALLNYESRYGQFPPAYTVDENGRRMHSWRVLILPYLDLQDSYDEFKLNEPWNSPHNLAVAEKCFPDVFRCPMDDQPNKTATSYVMIVGPGCVSEGPVSAKMKDINSTLHTVLIAEIADSDIPWYEPRDLDATTMSYKINDPKKPSISSNHREGAQVAMADGSARFLHDEMKPEIIKKMTLRDAVPTDEELKEIMGE